MKDPRDLIGAAHIEVIPNHAFKPHPACRRPVEDAGVGDLELAKRHWISVSDADIGRGKRRGQTPQPSLEEPFHGTETKAIADLLQSGGIPATSESIVQSLIGDTGSLQLPFGPIVPIEP